MSRLLRLIVPCLAPIAALAQALAPCAPPALTSSLPADLAAYAALYSRCEGDAAYLAAYGTLLLRAGHYAVAADVLERALLLDPRQPEARQAYAQALAHLGQVASAVELAGGEALAASPWSSSLRLTLRAGYDDNLNRATQARGLTLTLPDGPLELPLAASARAQAGGYLGAEIDAEAQRPLAHGQGLALYGRLATRAAAADNDDASVDLAAEVEWPGATTGSSRLGAGWGHYQRAGETLQRYLRLAWRQRLPAAPTACGHQPGVDLDSRWHPQRAPLDYRLLQASYAFVCNDSTAAYVQVSLGREFASGDRPGGDAWRFVLRAQGSLPLRGAARLEGYAQYLSRREDGPYSPLLGDGARLGLDNLYLRLTAQQPIRRHWHGQVSLEYERQAANLALFRLERRALNLGLVRQW